jgi:hypothetical protein
MKSAHAIGAPHWRATIGALPRLSRRTGFWAIAIAFVGISALSTAPSSLYGRFEQRNASSP